MTGWEAATWAGGAAAAIAAYEGLRWIAVRTVRTRMRRSTKEFIRRHGVRLDRFKLTRRSFMKAELLSDPVIARAIAEQAAGSGESAALLRDAVEGWIDEIVPAFSVSSYYKVGYNAARVAMNLVYEVVIDAEGLEQARRAAPKDAVLVYVMNHRSNADYVLVAYMLARQIALAFAVGEWARVWPLDALFRSFGSYFVRRGCREPLYHVVLRRYVQLTCKYGITQGVFPEGGLSRDGRLRPPKIGLLDYIVRLREDAPAGEASPDVLFVPVGINFDRVLEDRSLLREGRLQSGELRPPGVLARCRSLAVFAVRFPFTVAVNLARMLTGRARRHGYATAAFGAPLSLDAWLAGRPDLFERPREERKAEVQRLAEEVMAAIGRVIPCTPVPVTALALRRMAPADAPAAVTRLDLVREVRGLREALRRRGARLVAGRGFESIAAVRRLDEERRTGSSDLVAFADEVTAADEAEATVAVALELLARRRVVRLRAGNVEIRDAEVLAYYARSIEHLA